MVKQVLGSKGRVVRSKKKLYVQEGDRFQSSSKHIFECSKARQMKKARVISIFKLILFFLFFF